MVAIMTMTPVHMQAHHHGLGEIGLVIGVHIGAMFLPSLVTGILVDRLGRIPMAVAAAATLLLAGITAALAPADALGWLILALALLGLGWNFGLISGTALVVDATPAVYGAGPFEAAPLSDHWKELGPTSFEAAHKAVSGAAPWLWDGVLAPLLEVPTFVTFGVLALLSGHLPAERRPALAHGLLTDSALTRTTIYFTHYLFEAYAQLGQIDALFDGHFHHFRGGADPQHNGQHRIGVLQFLQYCGQDTCARCRDRPDDEVLAAAVAQALSQLVDGIQRGQRVGDFGQYGLTRRRQFQMSMPA